MKIKQISSEEQVYGIIGDGVFRGTCNFHLSQEIGFWTRGESDPIAKPVLLSQGRYWTYDPSYAISFAYIRALETRTAPIVICKTENFEKGGLNYLDELKLIVLNKAIGLDALMEFYKNNLDRFPESNRLNPVYVYESLRSQFEGYQRLRAEKAKSIRSH